MKVICHYHNDQERGLTDPVLSPSDRRFAFRLYSGDICDPLNGQWFSEPYPTRVWRAFCRLPILPFIMWRWPFSNRSGYIGFKLYGADNAAYFNWMQQRDVYPGSQALCLSFRPFARSE